MQRQAFVSYAREDLAAVERLAATLRMLRCEVWLDEELAGGQAWWDVVLDRVRWCSLFVCAVSGAMVKSAPCAVELHYAVQLDKSLLPVLVEPMPLELLPPSLAVIQMVDFTDAARDPALRLAGAILDLSTASPLPTPLPTPPPAPISHLSNLGDRLRAPSLTVDEQLAVVTRLEEAATQPEQRAAVRQLVTVMLGRDDVLHRLAGRLETLLAGHDGEPPTTIRPAASGPAQRWTARLVAGHTKAKTFEIGDGSRTWALQLEASFFVALRAYVNGERWTGGRERGSRDIIALPGARPGTGELAIDIAGSDLDGLTLYVDGNVLYREPDPSGD